MSTPGFVGKRLTDARNARGISAVDLAEQLGVSPQSISKYENGHQKPKLEILFKLCGILRFSQDYFTRTPLESDALPIFWRGKMTAPANMQERAHVRLEWFKEVIVYLSRFFDFPSLNVPDYSVRDIEALQQDSLDSLARELREFWGIRSGPMPNVVEKMEENGIFITRIHVKADKLDAFFSVVR